MLGKAEEEDQFTSLANIGRQLEINEIVNLEVIQYVR